MVGLPGGSSSDLYAQRVDGQGVAQWTTNGIAFCTAANSQGDPVVVSDGAGGMIVAWDDSRNDAADIYVQRIDASGAALWTANGVALCTATDYQAAPAIASDGAGGAIVAWEDARLGFTNLNIYVQRIDASGGVQWTTDGVVLCNAVNSQWSPTIVSDGAGGAIVTWYDYRASTSDANIYAQRIDASGAVQWAANGVALCTATANQSIPKITTDGAGGAIVTWQDYRGGTTADIYAQRVNAPGAVQWAANGAVVCTATADQLSPVIASDGAGGAIVTWEDYRAAYNDDNIYAQRIDPTGAALWAANGVALCAAIHNQAQPAIDADGSGGAIVSWTDSRGSDEDVYAQRVDASGVVQWTADGVALETAPNDQYAPAIVANGVGGAIVAYFDRQNSDQDIYAQRVGPGGSIPTGVHNTPSASALMLSPNYPNPFSAGTAMELTLRQEEPVSVEIFDAAGRRVRDIEMGTVEAGEMRLAFDGRDDHARALPSGVYFYRVHAGSETVTRKMVLAR